LQILVLMSRIQNQRIHELTSFSQTPDNEKRMIDPQKGQIERTTSKVHYSLTNLD
jgi:hypothetical protein